MPPISAPDVKVEARGQRGTGLRKKKLVKAIAELEEPAEVEAEETSTRWAAYRQNGKRNPSRLSTIPEASNATLEERSPEQSRTQANRGKTRKAVGREHRRSLGELDYYRL